MHRRGLAAAALAALLAAARPARAVVPQPPDYGDLRRKSLAGDLAATGAVVGAIGIPLLVAVPPWARYSRVEQDAVVDSPAGWSVARGHLLTAEVVGIGVGTGLAMGGWLVGGGAGTRRAGHALGFGLLGAGVGAGVGAGLGYLIGSPLYGRTLNTSGEREWVLGYTVGAFTMFTGTAVGITTGVVLGGGKVQGRKRDEVQLALQLRPDASGALVPTPALTGRW